MLEKGRWLVFTQSRQALSGVSVMMSNYSEHDGRDSAADAGAIFLLILIAVITAVYWVSHQ